MWAEWGHYAGSGGRECVLKTWLMGRVGSAYLAGLPRGIGHLVSEEGERDGGCTPRGAWEVMIGGG